MAQETVVKAPPQHKEIEHLSDEERTKWLKTGEMPLLEEEITPANGDASATSKPGAGNSGKKAESGTADERPHEKRIKELSAREKQAVERAEAAERERDALRTEAEEYRTGKRKPEEKKDAGPKLLEIPMRPKMKDFMGADSVLDSDKYEAALDEYENKKTAYVNQQTQLRVAAQQQEQYVNNWKTELKAKYGDKSDGLDVKKTADKLAKTMQDAPAFFMFLSDSEVFTDLLFVLGTDPKLDELLAEAREPKTAARAVRKLFELEAGVKAELAKQAKKTPASGEEELPAKDNLTKAGKPITESSGASSSATDDGSSDYVMNHQKQFGKDWGEVYRERKNKEERDKRKKRKKKVN